MRNTGKFLAVAAIEGIVGWFASETVKAGVGDIMLRDYFLVLIWPLVIILGTISFVIWIWRSSGPSQPQDPRYLVRPEWNSANQVGHWNGVKAMALGVQADLRMQSTKDPTEVTVSDQNKIREAVDALDFQVAQYSNLWANGSLWEPALRTRWERTKRKRYQGAPWAEALWDRVTYDVWWLDLRDPMVAEEDGYSPW